MRIAPTVDLALQTYRLSKDKHPLAPHHPETLAVRARHSAYKQIAQYALLKLGYCVPSAHELAPSTFEKGSDLIRRVVPVTPKKVQLALQHSLVCDVQSHTAVVMVRPNECSCNAGSAKCAEHTLTIKQ